VVRVFDSGEGHHWGTPDDPYEKDAMDGLVTSVDARYCDTKPTTREFADRREARRCGAPAVSPPVGDHALVDEKVRERGPDGGSSIPSSCGHTARCC
jgi:hypothetical protein